ncbi:hypothetical protein ACI65C_011706 [Semiaphis heraclei]
MGVRQNGASEIQKINESIQIKIDSDCSQIEQTSNINELSCQEISLEMDENILVDHDLSNSIVEKQSLVDEELNAKIIEGTSNINELSFQEMPIDLDENILVDHDLSHSIIEKTKKQSLVDEEINVL